MGAMISALNLPIAVLHYMAAIIGGLWSAEVCLYVAAAIFGAQALVIWLSPAVALDRQPAMVDDVAPARC